MFLWVISTRIMMPTSILLLLLILIFIFIFTSVFMTVLVPLMLFILILILILIFVFALFMLLVLGLTFWFPCNGRDPLLCLKTAKEIRSALKNRCIPLEDHINSGNQPHDRDSHPNIRNYLKAPKVLKGNGFLTRGKSTGAVSLNWKASFRISRSNGCIRVLVSLE